MLSMLPYSIIACHAYGLCVDCGTVRPVRRAHTASKCRQCCSVWIKLLPARIAALGPSLHTTIVIRNFLTYACARVAASGFLSNMNGEYFMSVSSIRETQSRVCMIILLYRGTLCAAVVRAFLRGMNTNGNTHAEQCHRTCRSVRYTFQ